VHPTVYNAAGQAVRILVDKMQGPGYYTVQWDGRDARGRATPANIYFTLKSDGFVARKKMVMVK